MNKKPLLVFAHRGEAKAFLVPPDAKKIPFIFTDVFECKDYFVASVGEGLTSASEKTACVCTALSEKVAFVVNLGVAGALSEDLCVGEIYSIRTVYAEKSPTHMQFKSFSSDDHDASIDCVSALERVLEPAYAKKLRPFAALVDRELWSIASVAKLFNFRFYAFKLVSDIAGDVSCQNVTAKVDEASAQLLGFYRDRFAGAVKEVETQGANSPPMPGGFYATTSQQQKFLKLARSLCIKHGISDESSWQTYLEKLTKDLPVEPKQNAKMQTTSLLNKMQAALNPFQEKISLQLANAVAPLKDGHGQIKFSQDYEQPFMDVQFRIGNKKDIEKIKQALEKFDFQKVESLLNGNIKISSRDLADPSNYV